MSTFVPHIRLMEVEEEGMQLGAADQNDTGEDYLWPFSPPQEGESQWEAIVFRALESVNPFKSFPLNLSGSNSLESLLADLDFELEQVIEEMEVPPTDLWNEIELISELSMEGQLEAFPNPNKAECGEGAANIVGDLPTPTILSGDSGDLTLGDNLMQSPKPLEVEAQAGSTSSSVSTTSDGDYPQKSGGGRAPPSKGAGEKRHQCTSCPKTFSTSGNLKTHVLSKHVGANGPRKCPNGTVRNGGRAPPRKGAGEKRYQCTSCPKTFSTSGNLKTHVLSKHDADHKRPNCPTCKKSFSHPWSLQSHMLTHHGNHPNKCPTCDRGFLNPSSLKVHINTHTGLRPFKCSHCPRDFTQSGHLSRHVRSLHVRQEP